MLTASLPGFWQCHRLIFDSRLQSAVPALSPVHLPFPCGAHMLETTARWFGFYLSGLIIHPPSFNDFLEICFAQYDSQFYRVNYYYLFFFPSHYTLTSGIGAWET